MLVFASVEFHVHGSAKAHIHRSEVATVDGVCVPLQETARQLPRVAAPLPTPPAVYEASPGCTSLLMLGIISLEFQPLWCACLWL